MSGKYQKINFDLGMVVKPFSIKGYRALAFSYSMERILRSGAVAAR